MGKMRSLAPIRVSIFLFFLCVSTCAQQTIPQIATPVRITQPIDDSLRTTLSGNTHPLAIQKYDKGEVATSFQLEHILLILRRSPQQEASLRQLLEDQQNIHSKSYHQWLTPQQFGERFGPSHTDITTVTQWLSNQGFTALQVSEGRDFIEFSGSAGMVKQAFAASIHTYLVNGKQHWANAEDPSIPSALALVVAGIDSLNNFPKIAQNRASVSSVIAGSPPSPSPSDTIFEGTNGPTQYAVVPFDFAAIYDLLPLWNATPTHIDGTGQTIAIAGRSDINPDDTTSFWSNFGLDGTHAPEPKLVIIHNGPDPGTTSDEIEGDIDTQWSGAVAPGATIDYVVSQSTETTDGIDLSALYIVDNNLAPVLSVSYGECEKSMGASGIQFFDTLWEQAAAQGISAVVSSGDSGAAGCDDPSTPAQSGLQVNGLASTPFNTAVGGTDFNQYNNWTTYWSSSNDPITKQSATGYIPETTWNDSCTNGIFQQISGGAANAEANCNNSTFAQYLDSTGGGGGVSSTWLKPDWQTGTPSDNGRDLPDVSLFAGNGFIGSYYFVCKSDYAGSGGCWGSGYLGLGGTSVAAPQFAGIMALINQKAGSPQGNPGFVLYKLSLLSG